MESETMKALVYTAPGEVRLEDHPLPGPPGVGELLVRVKICGICGSDVTDWYMAPRAPVVLGHEPAGDVVAVGEGVTEFAVGDRVALHHHMPCLVCDLCRRGAYTNCPQFKKTRLYPAGMAEFVRVPPEIVAGDVLKLPPAMSYEVGSMIEPVACIVRALDRANVRGGDSVIVMGAGFNGVVFALLAPHWGADRVAILDRVPTRLERARSLGLQTFNVDEAALSQRIREWSGGNGAHVVVVTPSKTPVIEQGMRFVAPGGTLMMYGPPAPDDPWLLDANYTFFKEINITSSYSASPYDTRRALSLLSNGMLNAEQLITHRFPLVEADHAWYMTKQAGDSLKIIVEI